MMIGSRIEQLRRDHGMTARFLASKLGMHEVHLRKVEKGEFVPRVDIIPTLCELFHVKPDVFFTDEVEKNGNEQVH